MEIPVPPLPGISVPDSVIVPDDVIGLPEVVKPVVPPETETLVTVPAEIAVLVTAVIWPLALTVKTGIVVLDP